MKTKSGNLDSLWRGRLGLVVSGVLLLRAFAPPFLHAQVAAGLSPALVNQTFKPGQPFDLELTVTNGRDAPVQMRGVVMDWWYDEANQKVLGPAGSLPHSASNWIEFVPRQFTVPANGASRVKLIVTPPATTVGGYYSAAFLESKPELAQAATAERKAIFTNVRLGCLLMLSAENTEEYKINVSEVQLLTPQANRNLRLDFTLDNQSNSHIFPRVELVLLNAAHELVAKSQGETKRFLPNQKQRLTTSWGGSLAPGNYTAILTIVYGKDKIFTQEFPFTSGADR
jgi:hypothetical protein